MAKDKKDSDNKKKAESAKKSPKIKSQNQSKDSGYCGLTWVGAGYQFVSLVRIIRKISDRAHPASYVKSAKDNLVMPIVKRNCPELTQDIVGGAIEIIEFIISPTRYVLNIVSYTVAEATGELIKKNYTIKHPELRAGIDVVFSEAAYQAVDKISSSSQSQNKVLRFFNNNIKRDYTQSSSNGALLKSIATNVQFRSKL
ncbi:MAG: hypothetical protein K2X50_03095 [Gammaproteobacteria bacterium]|nr:hypothetical protein [Gammaproteobacteria bacterium]